MATLAAVTGLLAIAIFLLAPAAAMLGVLSPLAAFSAFGVALLGGMLLSLVFGAIGLFRTRAKTGLAGRGRAWIGILVGLGFLAFVAAVRLGGTVSPIHDVTTDIDDPPAFSEAIAQQPDRRNGVAYPDGGDDVPATQRELFPDLETLTLAATPAEAVEQSRTAALAIGWTVTAVDADSGIIEAHDTTTFFRFVDDVVIRVRSTAGGSEIDVRSNSRVGGGDLGANAKRIRAFLDKLTSMD
jgi:uncharacterized protein (DUF1499 family)